MKNFEILDYVHQFGRVGEAILYAPLFVPSFVQIGDSVVLDDDHFQLPEEFIAARESWVKSIDDLEVSFNTREIPYMFSSRETSEAEYQLLAEFIAESWRSGLERAFPERVFTVQIRSSAETGDTISIEFRQDRAKRALVS